MAINFQTNDPQRLLTTFKNAVTAGHVVTWEYTQAGNFTHTPPQWKYKAFLRPVIYSGQLTMNILCPKGGSITKEVYGIYHGRFIESMLVHCDELFSNATATAAATNSDVVKDAA